MALLWTTFLLGSGPLGFVSANRSTAPTSASATLTMGFPIHNVKFTIHEQVVEVAVSGCTSTSAAPSHSGLTYSDIPSATGDVVVTSPSPYTVANNEVATVIVPAEPHGRVNSSWVFHVDDAVRHKITNLAQHTCQTILRQKRQDTSHLAFWSDASIMESQAGQHAKGIFQQQVISLLNQHTFPAGAGTTLIAQYRIHGINAHRFAWGLSMAATTEILYELYANQYLGAFFQVPVASVREVWKLLGKKPLDAPSLTSPEDSSSPAVTTSTTTEACGCQNGACPTINPMDDQGQDGRPPLPPPHPTAGAAISTTTGLPDWKGQVCTMWLSETDQQCAGCECTSKRGIVGGKTTRFYSFGWQAFVGTGVDASLTITDGCAGYSSWPEPTKTISTCHGGTIPFLNLWPNLGLGRACNLLLLQSLQANQQFIRRHQ